MGKRSSQHPQSKVVSLRPATGPSYQLRPVLVLGHAGGPFGAAGLISESLRNEGFTPEFSPEPLPSLHDPNALEALRALLRSFAERTRDAVGAAVHPGVTVWAERPELATLGEELGLDVICPPPRVLALFANKLNLLGEADRLGIPHLVTSFDPIYSVREIEKLIYNQALARKPFPFVLKAVRGGGSFGIFVVHEANELERKISLWVEQVRRNLGEVTLFPERYIEGARHIVLPFARFIDGRFKTFPATDASLQCRYRKVVEFCPASRVGAVAESRMAEHARKLAEHVGYVGVGALEFLVEDDRCYLVEGTARLNTGFHLWERVAGTSAVAWQLAALEGCPPGQEPIPSPRPEWRSGIALRLYAEDSLLQLPQPGEVFEVSSKREWHLGGSISAELDLHVEAGVQVRPSDYGMVGMLWCGAPDAKKALNVARGVLDELWIAGSIQTNERFLAELLAHPWVKEGIFHAGFVDEEFLPAVRPSAEVLGLFPSVLQSTLPGEPSTGGVVRWAVGDQWVKPGPPAEIRWADGPRLFEHEGLPGVSGSVEVEDGHKLRVCAFPLSENKWQVRIGEWVLSVRRIARVPGEKPQRAPKLFSLIHGRVHSLLYREGSVVPAHEPLAVLEALGALVPHSLPVEVRITHWCVAAEAIVKAGDVLAEFELTSKGHL
jgi:acetyl-CoA carboxylase biotin carboxylase subunit